MPAHRRARFVALVALLRRQRPDVDPAAITERRVLVDGGMIDNPRARVRADSSLRVIPTKRLRGDIKLSSALDAFGVSVARRVAVDVGASAGGFTSALLDRGARRVYAVDAGLGQLAGRLRRDSRVINLEGHNIADLDATVIEDVLDIVTMDLSYLPVADAIGQLGCLRFSRDAELVALVKPTFELRRATLAVADDDLAEAFALASGGTALAGWVPIARCSSPTTGRHGAREVFVHAKR